MGAARERGQRIWVCFVLCGCDLALEDAETFTQAFSHVQFAYRRGPVQATRLDFSALDLPVLVSTLSISNQGAKVLELRALFVGRV